MIGSLRVSVLATLARRVRAVGRRRRPRPHRRRFQDARRDQVGAQRRRHQRVRRALRRPEQARPIRRAHQVAARQHEPAPLPSERSLLRRDLRHLVDGHRARSSIRRARCRRPRAATSSTTRTRSTTTAPRTRRRSSRCGAWARRRPRRRGRADAVRPVHDAAAPAAPHVRAIRTDRDVDADRARRSARLSRGVGRRAPDRALGERARARPAHRAGARADEEPSSSGPA